MTTTGYGNQVPSFLPARVVSVVVMLFGSLFLSMPLAIIGNEYSSAWEGLADEECSLVIEKAAEGVRVAEGQSLHQGQTSASSISGRDGVVSPGKIDSKADIRISPEVADLMAHAVMSPLLECRRNVEKALRELNVLTASATKMTPAILLAICELRGWIAPLLYNIRTAVETLTEGEVTKEQRKISVFRKSTIKPNAERECTLVPLDEQYDNELEGCQVDEKDDMGSEEILSSFVSGAELQQQVPDLVEGEEDEFSTPESSPSSQNHSMRWPFSHKSPSKSKVIRTVTPVSDEEESMSFSRNANTATTTCHCDGNEEGDSHKSEFGRRPVRTSGTGLLAVVGEEGEGVEMKPTSDSKHKLDHKRREVEVSNPRSREARRGSREVSRALRGLNRLSSSEWSIAITRKFLGSKNKDSISFLVKMAKSAPDIANKWRSSEDFAKNMERAVQNPKSLRTRIWMLMEFPHSSKGARMLQYFFIFLILLSVFMLYTQTLPTFSHYGEDSYLCGKVLGVYCMDKDDPSLDAGCFVHNSTGVTNQRLRYNCNDLDCFAHGINFGARYTNVTCADEDNLPFETSDQLSSNFRAPDFIVSRDKMHQIQAVCTRIECKYDAVQIVDGNHGWVPLEIFVNFCFTVEIFLRIFVSNSLYGFFMDILNVFDMLSVAPFYVDIITALREPNFSLDFAILASSPEPILLVMLKSIKVFRLFKITRHFSASQVLVTTANKAWRQIVGILMLLFFIVTVFALLLYEVEKGTACYVGDSNCDVPDDIVGTLKDGRRISVNKLGEESKFSNILDALWFSIVTLTSVGYGEIVPVTNIGQIMSIFLMLFGAFYLAMPLTVAASTFWEVHQSYLEKQQKKEKRASKKIINAVFMKRMTSLEESLKSVVKSMESFLHDVQLPHEMVENKVGFLQRCIGIERSLSTALQRHDLDLRRLSVAFSNHVSASNRGSAAECRTGSSEGVGI
eukprot:CAMPEP_0185031144 /NCGR_PEP_ID=MMETSP1103-20130426/18444_1 /TAXON_ID=36769 /ORGANISM="Paraphysomonas bandaiensis, Strain Caron Lab Isolate" /LENGTH=962 /DNA_ID=CAMNT_0027566563 /DNA_START=709 /DNA_END=3597 /DNA_ORIENTATION=-